MSTMTINRNDIRAIGDVLDKFEVDHFKLLYRDTSSVSYTLEVEFSMEMNGRTATVRIPVTNGTGW